ncbi:MAG: nucleotide exchange factor GrpE [Holosporales bacterium]|jgi:molecular chaperone GrpE|nr:nucleotide exchange factor GrpE [Holosporales bacterium]
MREEKKTEKLDESGQEPIENNAEDLRAKASDLEDKLLRSVAENQNLRKICEKEKADISKYCISAFAKDILIVRDNLSLALSNCDKDNNIVEGVRLTLAELDRILESYGIKIIEALGKEFDPNIHQAIIEIEDNAKSPGIVVKVMQEGFIINGRLLRPALVGVSKKCS